MSDKRTDAERFEDAIAGVWQELNRLGGELDKLRQRQPMQEPRKPVTCDDIQSFLERYPERQNEGFTMHYSPYHRKWIVSQGGLGRTGDTLDEAMWYTLHGTEPTP